MLCRLVGCQIPYFHPAQVQSLKGRCSEHSQDFIQFKPEGGFSRSFWIVSFVYFWAMLWRGVISHSERASLRISKVGDHVWRGFLEHSRWFSVHSATAASQSWTQGIGQADGDGGCIIGSRQYADICWSQARVLHWSALRPPNGRTCVWHDLNSWWYQMCFFFPCLLVIYCTYWKWP